MMDMLSDVGFTHFNYTLRFGKEGLDSEVPFRISALHYITCYVLWGSRGRVRQSVA